MKRSFNLIRLAAVPLSLTLISILAGSVINRVMVVELGLPVTLVRHRMLGVRTAARPGSGQPPSRRSRLVAPR